MTIWISRDFPWVNFGRLHMWCARIGPPCEKLWLFEFLERFRFLISSVSIYDVPESDLRVVIYDHLNFSRYFVVQFRASRYMTYFNRTSVWKVMTIWISRDLTWINFGRLRMWCAWIGPPCDNLWKFEFLERFRLFNFERLDIWCAWIGHPSENLWPLEFLEMFRCSISRVWIYYAPESYFHVKSYDHSNFSRTSVV